jgi:glycosyltransferase involved in cell wall biosynthesis
MVSLKYPPLSGGAENQAHLLAQALVRRGIAVTILSARFELLPTHDRVDGVAVLRLPYLGRLPLVGRAPSTGLLLLRVVVAIVRARRTFDIVHAHIGNPFSAAALVGARLARRPSILKMAASGRWSDFLNMRSGRYGLFGRLTSPWLNLADRFIALNAESESELKASVRPEHVRRIPNGVAPTSARWQAATASRFVFAAGRLDRQKGFDLLIEACRGGGYEVVIAGEGPERGTLSQLADRVGCRLRLLGHVDHAAMRDWFLAAGLVVAPSRAEGMSNAVLEALALGCPVVASNVPGNADLIEHGLSGWLVPTEDARGIRAAIDSLLTDRLTSGQLGRAAAEIAEREFSIDAVAARYVQLYAELCEH